MTESMLSDTGDGLILHYFTLQTHMKRRMCVCVCRKWHESQWFDCYSVFAYIINILLFWSFHRNILWFMLELLLALLQFCNVHFVLI